MLIYRPHYPVPANFVKDVFVWVGAEPGDYGLTYNVILGYVAPITGIFGVVAVVAHHPIVVHFKGIAVSFFAVYQNILAIYSHFIALVPLDSSAV